jgi:hypothetical protein
MLRDIEDQAALLDPRPSMAILSGEGGGGLASHQVPANLDVLVANDPRRGTGRIGYEDADPWGIDDTASVLDVLHSWARIVREERELTQPTHVTISGERDCLTRNLEWMAEQPFIDETFEDLRQLLRQLRRTNHTQAEQPAGTCVVPTDTGVCAGRIWRRASPRVVWRVTADRCSREPVTLADGPAYCERCNTEWDGIELDRLNLILEQQKAERARPMTDDGRPMLTAAELCSKMAIRWGALRTRASRLGVKAVDGYYDEQWFRKRGDESVA